MANHGAHLYFIEMAEANAVKIGRGDNPQRRLVTLQIGSPFRLKLLGVLDGCGHHERTFHKHLLQSWIRGEWYRWTEIVAETAEIALSGGDWLAKITEHPPELPIAADDWRIGSPLYQDDPRYQVAK